MPSGRNPRKGKPRNPSSAALVVLASALLGALLIWGLHQGSGGLAALTAPLLAFTTLLVLIALWMLACSLQQAQQQLALLGEQLAGSGEQQRQQLILTQRQRFEASFFSMLEHLSRQWAGFDQSWKASGRAGEVSLQQALGDLACITPDGARALHDSELLWKQELAACVRSACAALRYVQDEDSLGDERKRFYAGLVASYCGFDLLRLLMLHVFVQRDKDMARTLMQLHALDDLQSWGITLLRRERGASFWLMMVAFYGEALAGERFIESANLSCEDACSLDAFLLVNQRFLSPTGVLFVRRFTAEARQQAEG